MSIGLPLKRVDAEAKVTGSARYTDDNIMLGMRHAKYVRSKIAHGKVIAIDATGKLLAVKTLQQSETPALGGHLGDWPNAWLGTFTGKSSDEPTDTGWALKKDQGQFDQIAGATITSRAAINAIHDALRYFDAHRTELLGSDP